MNPILRLFSRYQWGASPENAREVVHPANDIDEDDDTLAGDRLLSRTSRPQSYRIFDHMADFDLVASVLEAYAEDATQPDPEQGRTAWVESSDPKIVEASHKCLDHLKIEDRITAIAYNMSKRGDHFRRLAYSNKLGVIGWRTAPPSKTFRVEDALDRLVGFKQTGQKFREMRKSKTSYPWDYAHFRLLGRDEDSMYGTSLLAPMFRAWRQLVLTEDAALTYRMQRAPDRYAVWVDMQATPPERVARQLNRWRSRFNRHEYADPATGTYRQKWNPLQPLEHLFLPMYENTQTRIDTLPGSGDMGQMFDLEYYTNKFFGAARAPKAYFGFEGDLNGKTSLSQQDMRFARSVKRVQRSLKTGIRTTLEVNMHLMGMGDEASSLEWAVKMAPPSYLEELDRAEILRLRNETTESLLRVGEGLGVDPKVWSLYVMIHHLKLPSNLIYRATRKFANEAGAGDAVESGEQDVASMLTNENKEALDRIWDAGTGAELTKSLMKCELMGDLKSEAQLQRDQSMCSIASARGKSHSIEVDKDLDESWRSIAK